DPHIVDYPIPANDDAVGSIQYIVEYIMEAWVEGKKSAKKVQSDKVKEEEKALEKEKKPKTIVKTKTPKKGKKDVKSKPRKTKKTS
ncbi:MAG: 30S ribosomal protein S2, partial [Candidatus Levybacteria bacterium GW2011_GWB1_41_21]